MSKIIFHIGPHKTGSTYIQHIIAENRPNYPRQFEVIVKHNPLLKLLRFACETQAKRQEDNLALISDLSKQMASSITAPTALISEEVILGPLPSRYVYPELFDQALIFLPIIRDAFCAQGHDITFAFYIRQYDDWLRSLYRHNFIDNPNRPFAPKRYKQKRNLPDNWITLQAQLHNALGKDHITFINYETDRATKRLGTALFQLCDFSTADLERLDWLEPKNVSRPETVDPKNW
jgi:hypothetical protein